MVGKTMVLRGQTQALTAVTFALVHGFVAKGLFSPEEMRQLIEAADDNLPDDVHPVATQLLALLISAIPESDGPDD